MLITIIIGFFISYVIMMGCGYASVPLIILISFVSYVAHKKIIKMLPENKTPYGLLKGYHCLMTGIVFGVIGYCVYTYLDYINTLINKLLS